MHRGVRYDLRMIRIVATLCFTLTLLCPLVCLAGVGDCVACSDCPDCSDCGPQADSNCEAMAVGALVAKSVGLATFRGQALGHDWVVRVLPRDPGSRPWGRLGVGDRSSRPPLPAATRQALLQIFLF